MYEEVIDLIWKREDATFKILMVLEYIVLKPEVHMYKKYNFWHWDILTRECRASIPV